MCCDEFATVDQSDWIEIESLSPTQLLPVAETVEMFGVTA